VVARLMLSRTLSLVSRPGDCFFVTYAEAALLQVRRAPATSRRRQLVNLPSAGGLHRAPPVPPKQMSFRGPPLVWHQ